MNHHQSSWLSGLFPISLGRVFVDETPNSENANHWENTKVGFFQLPDQVFMAPQWQKRSRSIFAACNFCCLQWVCPLHILFSRFSHEIDFSSMDFGLKARLIEPNGFHKTSKAHHIHLAPQHPIFMFSQIMFGFFSHLNWVGESPCSCCCAAWPPWPPLQRNAGGCWFAGFAMGAPWRLCSRFWRSCSGRLEVSFFAVVMEK